MQITTLHPITHGPGYRNTYCVPAAMSAALGITVQEAASRLRELRGKRSVAGASPRDAEAVIRDMPGMWASTVNTFATSGRQPTLAEWLEWRDEAAYDSTFLVSIGAVGRLGHMLAVRGSYRADNIYGGPKLVWSYSMRWASVRALTFIVPEDWQGPFPFCLPSLATVFGNGEAA